jgi:pimeloyl-ACP methyl ester carboxylesterase
MATRHLGRAQELRVPSADGTLLHVEVRGPDDGPTLVLSHCWATSLATWGRVVRALDPGLRVVLYDQRGHGRSQAPLTRAGYSTDRLADDLCAVLEATVPEGSKAVVAGHSMGGMTIMASAPRPAFADRAAAVLLTNTGCTELVRRSTAIPLPGPLGPLGSKLFLTTALPLGPANAVTAQLLRFIVLGSAADPRTVRLCARLVHDCGTVPRARWGGVLSTLELDEAARRITVPTTVLVGAEDKFTPPWHAHHMAEVIPGATAPAIEVPGVGHMGPLECPGLLADHLNRLAAEYLEAEPARV